MSDEIVIRDCTILSMHEQPRSLADIDVKLVTDIGTAWECANWLSTLDRVSIDTETTGLSPEKDEVRLIQFGDANTSYVVPLEGVTYDLVPRAPQVKGWGGFAVDVLRRIARYGMKIDMHNATYDHSMIHRTLGVELPRDLIHDTRLMAHVHDAHGPLALKSLARRLVDPHANLGQEILDNALGKKSGWSWATVPIGFKPYWFYAGLDTILTSRVRAVLEPLVLAEAPRAYELELAVSWPCEAAARRGARVDVEYTKQFASEMTSYLHEVETWGRDEYGISLGSSDKIISILQADGVNLLKRTPSGAKFSLDKEVLADLDHPLAQAVRGRRQAQKLLGYLNSYLELSSLEPDGFIHPNINTVGGSRKSVYESGGDLGVRTSRMSMSDPNFQNVPVRTKEGARVRRCFVPREGATWVKCDADQIESRILAHLSGDPHMRQAFLDAAASGGDFFVNMARTLFNDPSFMKADPRRQFVKNGCYAKIYGAGIPKFAKTAGASLEEAGAFMTAFDEMFAAVPRWIGATLALARSRQVTEGEAYVRSPLTGRRHVADRGREFAIINYLIQGLAAEILKLKIVEADQAGLTKYFLFPVHDELDFDPPTDELPDFLATLSEVMNDDKLLSVPITWSADTGPTWGDCK